MTEPRVLTTEDGNTPEPMLDLRNMEITGEERKINRVTVRLSAARERSFEQCEPFPNGEFLGFVLPIDHEEAAFQLTRTMKLGEVYKIDTYHVEEPTIMVILNRTKWKSNVLPSQKQIKNIYDSIVAVGFDGVNWPLQVSPGRTQHLLLTPGQQVYLNPLHGTPQVSIFAV